MDAAALRAEFPVLGRKAYLNAGTCGPLPRAARRAVDDLLDVAEDEGRALGYFERTMALHAALRAAYARVLHADAADVALTTSTSEGIVRVVAGLGLGAGDEVLTSDAEHPGLLGPLLAARERFGVTIRAVPLAEVPGAVGPATKLVACSHVGWLRGDVVPDLSAVPADVPVLLDGAQSVGAVPVDVGALGCAFFAGPGQKWLCGPVGTGMLHVAPAWQERLQPIGPTYFNYARPSDALAADALHEGARRHDTPALAPELAASALAALHALDDAGGGWTAIHERARGLAQTFATALADAGRELPERGPTTLVTFPDPEPSATAARLAANGVTLRDLPGTPWLRASVGAWNDESDLERLLDALAAGA